ncbi:MAG: M28 family peptidase [Flavobacteriales bacterium]|nr:M28 family peptidase [Flavobacteriales bacterium]
MRKFVLLTILLNSWLYQVAQNVDYAQGIIDTLTSDYFYGRGYVQSGDEKAARFISDEFQKLGVKDLNGERFHEFSFPVNTFPGDMQVEVDGKMLRTGIDYVVDPSSAGIHQKNIKIKHLSEYVLLDDKLFAKAMKRNHRAYAVMVDTVSSDSTAKARRKEFINGFKGHCLIQIETDLTWSVARHQSDQVIIKLKPGWEAASTVSLQIDAEFQKNHVASNVLGFIPGTAHPDSFIVLTGHYDHLGGMGNATYIPGANDNASGIAMILDMADYFVKNPPRYSVVLIGFAGEEAGLVGSYFFVQEMDQYLDKNRIKFLLNMDLMGSGEKGIMAVNGKVFTDEYALLENRNKTGNYLTEVRSRGKAANSDHYFFSEAGVHCFFVYLMGDYSYYHAVSDSSDNLRLTPSSYNGAFNLLTQFLKDLMRE